MKYTKEELLGAMFVWNEHRYEVVSNGEDVQLKHIYDNSIYPSRNLDYLNSNCLSRLDVSSIRKKYIHDYSYLIKFLDKLNIK